MRSDRVTWWRRLSPPTGSLPASCWSSPCSGAVSVTTPLRRNARPDARVRTAGAAVAAGPRSLDLALHSSSPLGWHRRLPPRRVRAAGRPTRARVSEQDACQYPASQRLSWPSSARRKVPTGTRCSGADPGDLIGHPGEDKSRRFEY